MSSRALYYILIVWVSGFAMPAYSQNYQAMHGSSMAGSLGVSNNPASIVHVPFSWDVTLFSVQEQHTTNSIILKNGSYLNAKNTEVVSNNGVLRRFVLANQDLHLLNARIRLDDRQTIAFGVNLRSMISARTAEANWQDTIQQLYTFLDLNRNRMPLSGEVRANSWAEIYGTYARTLIDDGKAILNAGVTLTLTRGLAGGYLNASNLNYFPSFTQVNSAYNVATGEVEYGYSANIDDADDNNSIRELTRRTFTGISANLGIEYIIPTQESASAYDYDWKIGVSALDLGYNSYLYSRNSRFAVMNKQDISDSLIEASFKNVSSIEEANDTLARLAGSIATPTGKFSMVQPARLVINVDRRLQDNFYVNAQLTIPLTSVLGKDYLFVRQINLLAVTPRYETRMFGAYLPVTFNSQRQMWIGGALRAGPVLFGVHNWGNVFGKNSLHRGGFYLALTFRPGKKRDAESKTGREFEGEKLSRKARRQLDCPPY